MTDDDYRPWPPADVVARIALDFPAEPAATVLSLLESYQGAERSRVARSVLHLAGGDADRLLELIENATTDYRDVIYWAEYDEAGLRVRDLGRPFGAPPPVSSQAPGSFIGGRPFLPPGVGIPACALCSARMCFFFQVALPPGHGWQGALVAMFQCVACCSEDALIPEMLSVPLPGAGIPGGFLARYQTNFRVIVGDAASASCRSDYEPLIERRPIDPSSWRIGAEPEWLLEDEAPGSYESFEDPVFLFQVPFGTAFPVSAAAPPQKTLDLEGQVVDADRRHYELFLGNASYFFGFGRPAGERAYVVTQAA